MKALEKGQLRPSQVKAIGVSDPKQTGYQGSSDEEIQHDHPLLSPS